MGFIFLKDYEKQNKSKEQVTEEGPQGMKYLLPGSLQRKFANPSYKILNTLKH